MQLGEIIRSFSEEASANEALLACNDIVLFARVGDAAASAMMKPSANMPPAPSGDLPTWPKARTGSA